MLPFKDIGWIFRLLLSISHQTATLKRHTVDIRPNVGLMVITTLHSRNIFKNHSSYSGFSGVPPVSEQKVLFFQAYP